MFNWTKKRRELEEIKKRLDLELIERYLANKVYSMVSCETCGCLIYEKNAIKGKGILKEKKYQLGDADLYKAGVQEYIYCPYYCKIHAPKVRK